MTFLIICENYLLLTNFENYMFLVTNLITLITFLIICEYFLLLTNFENYFSHHMRELLTSSIFGTVYISVNICAFFVVEIFWEFFYNVASTYDVASTFSIFWISFNLLNSDFLGLKKDFKKKSEFRILQRILGQISQILK